jgi:hypothetical protein
MAFKDIDKVMYDGKVKIAYRDGNHRYYARLRKSFELPEENPKAWDKALAPGPIGCTTLLGNTLEKKGLMKYALTKALMDLFGFYTFTDDFGEKKQGYSPKGIARLFGDDGKLIPYTREEAADVIAFGAAASDRHTKKGADIGSVVHDAIEHYVKGLEFDIPTKYLETIEAADFETEQLEDLALAEYGEDTWCAQLAFERFVEWWDAANIELLGAEDLIYSMKYNICGTFDGLLRVPGKGVVLADWKTSNASQSTSAGMPEGINYQYFIQSAIYAMAWMEMGNEKIDDLAIVSCRKDGAFTVIYASDLGLTVDDAINWAKAVIVCLRMMDKTKAALWQHGIDSGVVIEQPKKGAKK